MDEYYKENLAGELEKVDPKDITDGYHSFSELYDYRMLYNAALFNEWAKRSDFIQVVKSWKHSDGEPCFGGGWFIVMAKLPTGQISNHYNAAFWDLFQIPEWDIAPEYDGHTPAVAAERLRIFILSENYGIGPKD